MSHSYLQIYNIIPEKQPGQKTSFWQVCKFHMCCVGLLCHIFQGFLAIVSCSSWSYVFISWNIRATSPSSVK